MALPAFKGGVVDLVIGTGPNNDNNHFFVTSLPRVDDAKACAAQLYLEQAGKVAAALIPEGLTVPAFLLWERVLADLVDGLPHLNTL